MMKILNWLLSFPLSILLSALFLQTPIQVLVFITQLVFGEGWFDEEHQQ